jgi:PAS domain S-box-containing protein
MEGQSVDRGQDPKSDLADLEAPTQTQDRVRTPGLHEQMVLMQAKLDALLDHASSGVAIYRAVNDGDDFILVGFNHGAEEIEHVRKEEVLGKNVLEVFPGIQEFRLLEIFRRVWRTGEPEHQPVSIYKDLRTTGWRRNYVCKLPNGDLMAIYDDVTQTKRSELATRMGEQIFRAIANYAYDWEIWVGPNGRVLWMNPAATRISGYSVEEVTAMRDFPGPLVYEPDRERIVQAFESAVKGGTGTEQFRMKHKDGRTLWAETTWQPIYDEKGNSLGHRESIRDVTARKLAEQAAEVAEWEEEAILDSMAEHVVHLDTDGSILWANRAACESAGMGREELVGRFWYEMPLEWHEALDSCPALEAMEKGQRIEMEKATGDGRTWFIQAAPLRDANGAIVGGVEISLDISAYKHAEESSEEVPQEERSLETPAEVNDPPADRGQASP